MTGITIADVSVIGNVMTLDLSRTIPYTETRTRWTGLGENQPATTGDIDGNGDVEIVVLGDTGSVYVFKGDGSEYDDADGDPTTIEPYITAPGAVWAGPPALGNLVGQAGSGDEIVAAAREAAGGSFVVTAYASLDQSWLDGQRARALGVDRMMLLVDAPHELDLLLSTS